MKLISILAVILTPAFAVAGSGFLHNSQLVNTPSAGHALYSDLEKAEKWGSDVDVCYEGDYEEAIAVTEEKVLGAITIELIGVVGEGKFPTLDLEIYNERNAVVSALVPPCQ